MNFQKKTAILLVRLLWLQHLTISEEVFRDFIEAK